MQPANSDQIYTYRYTRKVRVGGSTGASILLILLGLFFILFILWPLGVVLLIVAGFVGAKYKYISTCGYCGNEVSHTSRLCPTCHADLAAK